MDRRRLARPLLALALLLPLGCPTRPPPGAIWPTSRGPKPIELCAPVADGSGRDVGGGERSEVPPLVLTYLRAGGIELRFGEHVVATPPFYSNPGLLELALPVRITPDREAIPDDALARDTDAILVGHGHYDHLMDLPVMLEGWSRKPVVWGTTTTVNLLASTDLDVRAVNAKALQPGFAGEPLWIVEDRVSVLPILSEHAPHVLGIGFFEGPQTEPRQTLPEKAGQWKGGEAFAYLIDFHAADGSLAWRVHYQDAASEEDQGWPPIGLQDTIDVAVVCGGGYPLAKEYPEAFLRAFRPGHVVVSHWEDFFRPTDEPLKSVRLSPMGPMLRAIECAREDDACTGREPQGDGSGPIWTLPEPGARMVFRHCRE